MSARPDPTASMDLVGDGALRDGDSLRILWLCPYLPLPLSGAGSRVFNLIKVLAATAHIDLIATSNEWHERHEMAAQLRSLCRTVQVVPQAAPSRRERRALQLRSLLSRRPAQYWTLYSDEMQDRIDQALRNAQYDVVILEHSFTGYYHLAGDIPMVLDQHNVESEILQRTSQRDRSSARRALSLLEFWKFRSDEQRICRAADLLLAVSQRDRDAMLNWGGIANCCVVPNGVDVNFFSRQESEDGGEQPASILFTGPLHYAPNTEAVLYFGAEIWPLIRQQVPAAELTIVGANPPREIQQLGRLPGVIVTGFVPDVRPYLARTQVVVAPLRIGGGTRLKILEALAMRRAVVSTSLGCEGLDVQDGRHLRVADEPGEFAGRVVELLADPGQREALGRQGRRLVEGRYGWGAIGGSLDVALRRLLERERR